MEGIFTGIVWLFAGFAAWLARRFAWEKKIFRIAVGVSILFVVLLLINVIPLSFFPISGMGGNYAIILLLSFIFLSFSYGYHKDQVNKFDVLMGCILALSLFLISMDITSRTSLTIVGISFLLICFLMSLRWLSIIQNKVIFSFFRLSIIGTLAILGALPYLTVHNSPSNILAANLLAFGLIALLALFPLGGWLLSLLPELNRADRMLWITVFEPVCLIVAYKIVNSLPSQVHAGTQTLFLIMGIASALWYAFHTIFLHNFTRYISTYMVDISLIIACLGLASANIPYIITLVLVSYISTSFLINTGSNTNRPVFYHAAWLSVAGVIPSPLLWGRLLILITLYGAGVLPFSIAFVVISVIVITSLMELKKEKVAKTGDRTSLGTYMGSFALLCLALMAIFPYQIGHFIFFFR